MLDFSPLRKYLFANKTSLHALDRIRLKEYVTEKNIENNNIPGVLWDILASHTKLESI